VRRIRIVRTYTEVSWRPKSATAAAGDERWQGDGGFLYNTFVYRYNIYAFESLHYVIAALCICIYLCRPSSVQNTYIPIYSRYGPLNDATCCATGRGTRVKYTNIEKPYTNRSKLFNHLAGAYIVTLAK